MDIKEGVDFYYMKEKNMFTFKNNTLLRYEVD
jgi:hypothetical protein